MTIPLIQIGSTVRPMNEDEYSEWLAQEPERTQQTETDVRDERNRRLASCDWTQLPDAPVNAATWAIYRQKLRDVPSQTGFPWQVEWPAEPA